MRPEITLLQDGMEVSEINFGVVQVGTKKILNVEVKNKGSALLFDIVYNIPHPDVEIMNSPTRLGPDESGTLTLKYIPKEDREEGLRMNLSIKGIYVV